MENIKTMTNLQDALAVFRNATSSNASTYLLQVFLGIAVEPRTTSAKLVKSIGVDKHVVSRSIHKLIATSDSSALVSFKVNSKDSRERFLYLTRRGKKLAHKVVEELNKQ